MSELLGVDCYMRYTDKQGNVHVNQHRVVAGGKFVAWAIAAAEREGGSAEQITAEQYKEARK